MSSRAKVRLARAAWILTLVLALTGMGLVVLNGSIEGRPGVVDALLPVFTAAAYGTVGFLITSRRPENPIGWIYVLIGFGFGLTIFAQEYAIRALVTARESLPAAIPVAWVQTWSLGIAYPTPLSLLFLLLPNGRLMSKRWRILVMLALISGIFLALSTAVVPGEMEAGFAEAGLGARNPLALGSLEELPSQDAGATYINVIEAVCWSGAILVLLGSAISLLIRFFRSKGEERQQLKLIAYAGLVPPIAFTLSVTDLPVIKSAWVLGILGLAVGLPAASAVAILRYRLYDVELLVSKTLIYGVIVALLTSVYVGVVALAGRIAGGAGEGDLMIAALAAAVVAVLFQPIRARAQRFATRLVYGKRANPYEVLAEFSQSLSGTYTEEVLPDMARLIGEGTGAARAEVWLRLGEQIRIAAIWPSVDEEPPPPIAIRHATGLIPGTDLSREVRYGGELIGVLAIKLPQKETPGESHRKLLNDLATQAAFVLRNVRLVEELRASRQRLVTAQDQERRRLERDIHDGAQQQLVAMSVKLGLADTLVKRDPEKASALMAQLKADAADAVESLRDLARGIFPPVLADRGLGSAVQAHIGKTELQARVDDLTAGARFAPEVEANVYFTIREALQNTSKHARGAEATIRITSQNGQLDFAVSDKGPGFDPETVKASSGLQNMTDRIEAVGGILWIESAPDRGTTIRGRVPGGATRS
jgi:signal transduction histidine kinase